MPPDSVPPDGDPPARLAGQRAAFRVERLPGNPILHRDSSPFLGRNINGPSLIAAPPWVANPLGRYYLYFAHHRGTFIRLATADHLQGPWAVYRPGTLALTESLFPTHGRRPHIASPDVHVDPATETIRMYYHGLDTDTRVQHTRLATSHDGLRFEARPELLGRPYFRAFSYEGWWYAIGMPGILYRSTDGLGGFERGPRLFDRTMRHSALLVRGSELMVFWTRVGDRPERILCSPVALDGDWHSWRAGAAVEVLAPETAWEGADEPLEASVRGWEDAPVRQLRDPAIFCEEGRTYLLYSVAGESGIAIARLEVPDMLAARADAAPGIDVEPATDTAGERPTEIPDTAGDAAAEAAGETTDDAVGGQAETPRRRLARLDPRLTLLRQAVVTMAAVLGNFGVALFAEGHAHLTTNVVIMAVALALSVGRVSHRPEHRSGVVRWLSLLVLPLVAVGANEIGTRMLAHPNLGDLLFVVAVAATIWVRRFGPVAARIATLATLPLVAMLVVPGPVTATAGSSGGSRWWSALIAVSAVVWVRAVQLIAEQTGFLPRQAPPPSIASPTATRTASPRRVAASTKMALQMGVALAAAFVIGRNFFGVHWTWVVLTAFIVCSGNRGREDVAHKAVMRLLGAGAGTLAATALAGAFPPADHASIVAIFAVLAIALWLRPINYAYWAAGMTAALALLYGYYGEAGTSLLADRLEAIVVGAALAIAASWLLLPVRTTDVLRRDLARALAVLADYLAAIDTRPADLDQHQARFAHAVTTLDNAGRVLRRVPRRWRTAPDYLPALPALRRTAEALPGVTGFVASRGRSPGDGSGAPAVATLMSDLTALRRALGERREPDPEAWGTLADTVAGIPATLTAPQTRNDVGPGRGNDRLWAATERVLGYVNRTHATDYRLAARLAQERHLGTYLLEATDGKPAVLKWSRDPSSAARVREPGTLSTAEREAGGPAPARLASGATPSGFPYELLEYAPDSPPPPRL